MTADVVVDERGVCFLSQPAADVVEVLFDGNRVWSFDPFRDAVTDDGIDVVPWPGLLRRYLDGVTEVTVRDYGTGTPSFVGEVAFGRSSERIELIDENGHHVAVNKKGRVEPSFSQIPDEVRRDIAGAVGHVLSDLREVVGLEAFLAYGCLLGAARDGRLIGHDTDADVAFLSRHQHPMDVIRESRRAERVMNEHGWPSVRMSASVFRVWAELPEGRRCGVDVFASFYIDGVYYLPPSARGEFPRSSILPLGIIDLEGQELPAPRDVDALLEFTYGPGWRVPDPSFKHVPADALKRRLIGWFRGEVKHRFGWQTFYGQRADEVPAGPSAFAQWVDSRLDRHQHVIDLGAGTGRDAVWLAQRGHRVVALDFSLAALAHVDRLARDRGVTVPTRAVNLNELRGTLLHAAVLAHERNDWVIHARFLLDALEDRARHHVWRFASMTQRGGGPMALEFRTPRSAGEPMHFRRRRRFLEPEQVIDEVAAAGGTVVHHETGRGLATLGVEDPEVCRMIVRWAG